MPRPHLVRVLTLTVATTALLAVWALADGSWLALPLAVVSLLAAFGWTIERLGEVEAARRRGDAPAAQCGGCLAGCVECRERLDLPDAA